MNGTLTICFLSDTCFSVPAGLDATVDIDASVDTLGLPLVGGKTLHGLLRDTWLAAAPQIDPGRLGEALLGRRYAHTDLGALWIGDAGVEESTRVWVEWARRRQTNPLPAAAVRDAFLTRRTQTAIDRETGGPGRETLRTKRVVPAGTLLRAPLTLIRSVTEDHLQLLKTLAALTRHAGLARNRGLGHVQLRIDWLPEKTDPVPSDPDTPSDPGLGSAFLPFRLTLTAPCLVGGYENEPNSRIGRPYIPGNALRGAVAAALRHEGATHDAIGDIVASGRVRFLNAYPEASGQRAIPTPLTWRRKKDAVLEDWSVDAAPRDELLTLSGIDDPEETGGAETVVQRQRMHAGYYARSGSRQYAAVSRLQATTHQSRSRDTGSTRRNGEDGVFVYQALAAGQSFRGCLVLPPEQAALRSRLERLLTGGRLFLGRSARAGYGGSPQIELLPLAPFEAGARPQSVPKDGQFVVRLTSDAVLRDGMTGQHDPSGFAGAVARRFEGAASVEAALFQPVLVTGYQSLWRTELPALPGVAAGSVALLRAVRALDADELLARQAEPLGECAAEGYGCFLIETLRGTLSLEAPPEVSAVPSPADVPVPDTLRAAQNRLFRQRLQVLISARALEEAESVTSPPSPSLLQRLRTPLADPRTWRATYAAWLAPSGEGRLREPARRALEKAAVGRRSLHEFLLEAAGAGWHPPLEREEAEFRRYCLIGEDEARPIWNALREDLCTTFLDVFLHGAARPRSGAGRRNVPRPQEVPNVES